MSADPAEHDVLNCESRLGRRLSHEVETAGEKSRDIALAQRDSAEARDWIATGTQAG
jgi:hypothetical protein